MAPMANPDGCPGDYMGRECSEIVANDEFCEITTVLLAKDAQANVRSNKANSELNKKQN